MEFLNSSFHITIYLIIQIALGSIWLWLSRSIFPQHLRTIERYIISAGGGLAAIALVLYPLLITKIPINTELMYLPGKTRTIWGFFALITYMCIYTALRAPRKKIRGDGNKSTLFIITRTSLITLLIIARITKFYLPVTMIGYYMIVATTEELFKFSPTWRNFKSYETVQNDLILFGIMSAFGFALLENIWYGVHILQQTDTIPIILGITRGILGFMMHGIFSGTTAYLLTKNFAQKKKIPIIRGVASVLGGVTLHSIYNLLLIHNMGIGIIVYLIIGYLGISYLFFSSTSIYTTNTQSLLVKNN